MCPDPFNEIIDAIAITISLFFTAIFIISILNGNPAINIYVTLVGFIILCEFCYFFASRHYVFCGIPHNYPSRYEQYKIDLQKTEKDLDEEWQAQIEIGCIFEELKEEGYIDPERKLEDFGKWR
jgi:hypothetical protein